MERALCVKIFYETKKLIGHKMTLKSQKHLLFAKRSAPYDEFVASQLQFMRALFQHPNTGEGRGPLEDMCAGIDALLDEGRGGGQVLCRPPAPPPVFRKSTQPRQLKTPHTTSSAKEKVSGHIGPKFHFCLHWPK